MDQPDGNTAAERAYSAAQARAEERHDAYGEGAVQSIVDDLFEGKKVARLTLHDFVTEIYDGADVAGMLLIGRDAQIERLDEWKSTAEKAIREWCDGRGSDEVAERVASADEDARADAAEARAAVREEA